MTTHEWLMATRREDDAVKRVGVSMLKQRPRIVCADGFSMSVQASAHHYSAPRDNHGPWTTVEVGCPTERDDRLMPYAEDADRPTETVYAQVPVEVIDAVIAAHGGLAKSEGR